MFASIRKFVRDESALTTVEYAVAGGLIAAAAVTAFSNLGGEVTRVISLLVTRLSTVV